MTSRIAVVGLGRMGLRHCEAARGIPGASLSAVCDVRPDALRVARVEHPGARSYLGWRDLLSEEHPDLLVIATNGPSHAEIALTAFDAGVPRILCEKPMATSISDAEEMIARSEDAGVRLAVNHSRRWVGAYQRLAALLASGTIGDVRHVSFTLGGGQLACLGSHLFDLVRFLVRADPIRVLGFLDGSDTPNPRGAEFQDPGGYGIVWFSNGVRLFFDESEDFGTPAIMHVEGTVGRVVIDESRGEWTVLARRGADRALPMTSHASLSPIPFSGEPIDMIATARQTMLDLLDDAPILCSGEDGLASLRTVVAVHASHETGNAPVDLPLQTDYRLARYSFT
jgi:predicted dehydrogenase